MLSALIWGPILGAIAVALVPNPENDCYSRKLALGIMIALLGVTILLGWQFDLENPQMQFVEYLPWLPSLGLNYHLGVDGLSLPLLFLNSILVVVAIFSTNLNLERPRFYYALLLLLSGGVAGAFLAQDLLLFFLFFELEIIPLYFLIAIWGGQGRGYAADRMSVVLGKRVG